MKQYYISPREAVARFAAAGRKIGVRGLHKASSTTGRKDEFGEVILRRAPVEEWPSPTCALYVADSVDAYIDATNGVRGIHYVGGVKYHV
jgi:hypothetical protein